jgi:predicted exporter
VNLKARAAGFLVVVALVAAAGAIYLARGVPLQTNLLAMLPPTERDAEVEDVIAKLGSALAARVAFVISHADEAAARRGAQAFAAALEANGGLRSVLVRIPALHHSLPAELYAGSRFGLLSDDDRRALATGEFSVRETALRQLVLPLAQGLALPAAQDPFGFFGHWLATREPKAGLIRLEDGYLVAREPNAVRVLVLGEVAGDVYDQRVQERLTSTYARAADALHAAASDAELWRTGTVFYAAQARAAAMRDMERIGICAALGVALLVVVAFRSLRPMLLGLLSAAIGILVAVVVTLLVDGELHLVSLAFGASLIGEAVDYSILLFAAHLAAGAAWTPERGVASVRPGLSVAVGTSLLAYALVALLPFPGISQIARFALIGLAASYLAVLWLLPAFLAKPSARNAQKATAWAERLLDRWHRLLTHRHALNAALALGVLCIPGWLALRANDDVRLLVARDPELMTQENGIRRLTGLDSGGRFFLVRGADAEQVLERETALVHRLRALEGSNDLSAHQAVSDYVPPRAQQAEDRALVAKRVFGEPRVLVRELAEVGYRAEIGKRLLDDFQLGGEPVTVAQWLASPLSAPLRHLWSPLGERVPASVVTLRGERDPGQLAQAAAGLEGVTLVDKAASVSALLGRYRRWALPGLLVAAAAIFVVLALRYGAGEAPRLIMPVIGAELISVAIFGYSGEPLTLFAIGGWMLTLGIGVNYAIFLREGIERRGATAMAVLVSAATTLLAWGLLALSAMPALRQFGLALLTGIGAAVLLTPLALPRRSGA